MKSRSGIEKVTKIAMTITGMSAIAGLGLARSEYEKKQLRLTPYTIINQKIPDSFDGVRLAVLADLHDCLFGRGNRRIIDMLQKAEPDYIICAGDMILKTKPYDVDRVVRLMEQLTRIAPVYYGTGNHELYMDTIRNEEGISAWKEYRDRLEQVGVHVLSNESAVVTRSGDRIRISGLDLGLEHYVRIWHRRMEPGYCASCIGDPIPSVFQILIGHYPDYLPEYAEWGADLVFGGHIHGGTVRLPLVGGLMSPNFRFFPKYARGRFRQGACDMIVSGGLGTHSINARFGGNYPEIPIVTLQKKDNGIQ